VPVRRIEIRAAFAAVFFGIFFPIDPYYRLQKKPAAVPKRRIVEPSVMRCHLLWESQKTSGGGAVRRGGLSGEVSTSKGGGAGKAGGMARGGTRLGGPPAGGNVSVGGKSGGVDAGGTGGDIAPGGSKTSSGGDSE
jgi:hypothetical protein